MADKTVKAAKESDKSIEDQIADLELQILALRKKQREAAFLEFPKWIADPNDLTGATGKTVNNAEEEKVVLAAYEKAAGAAKKRLELERKIKALKDEHEKLVTEEAAPVKPAKPAKATRRRRAA